MGCRRIGMAFLWSLVPEKARLTGLVSWHEEKVGLQDSRRKGAPCRGGAESWC